MLAQCNFVSFYPLGRCTPVEDLSVGGRLMAQRSLWEIFVGRPVAGTTEKPRGPRHPFWNIVEFLPLRLESFGIGPRTVSLRPTRAFLRKLASLCRRASEESSPVNLGSPNALSHVGIISFVCFVSSRLPHWLSSLGKQSHVSILPILPIMSIISYLSYFLSPSYL